MSKTLILSGLPSNVNLSELAANLDKLFDTDDIGTFRIRKLDFNRFALDFENSYDAFSAQSILNGYYYTTSNYEHCRLKAKINTNARLECIKEPPDWESYLPPSLNEGNVVKSIYGVSCRLFSVETHSEPVVETCSAVSTPKRKRFRKRRRNSDNKTKNSDAEAKCPTDTKLPPNFRRKRPSSPDRPSVSLNDYHHTDGFYRRSRRKDINTGVLSDEENLTLDVEILDALTPVLEKVMEHFRRQCRVVLDTRFERVTLKEEDRERVIRGYLKVVSERVMTLKLNRYMVENDIVSEYKLRHPLKMDLALITKLLNDGVVIELDDSDEGDKEPADDIWNIVDEVLKTADKFEDEIEDEKPVEIKEEPESESCREPSPNITKINITIKTEPSK